MSMEPFSVDRAKTGRANCRGCRLACAAGELRMAKVTIGPYGDNQPMKNWYHIDCMMNAFLKQRATTKRVLNTNEIQNFHSLSPEDKLFILKKLNEMEVDFAKKHKRQPVVLTESSDDTVVPSTSKIESKNKNKEENVDHDHRDNAFEEFYNLCKNIAENPKYTDKTSIVQTFFSKGTDKTGFKGNVLLWVKLLLPGIEKRVYNLKDRQLVKLFARILQTDYNDMLEDLEEGNIGNTLENFFSLSTIKPAQTSTYTVSDVDNFLQKLSELTKEDEQVFHFKSIIRKCTTEDLKYIIYLIKGDLKMNCGNKHILNALHPDAYTMFQSTSDLDIVISKIKEANSANSSSRNSSTTSINAGLQLLKPISPMLAEACKSVDMAFKKCPNGFLSEIKYDGERIQLHKTNNKFEYYSRSLKNMMEYKIKHFKHYVPEAFPYGTDLILDGEILSVNTTTGKFLPFGTLGKNIKNDSEDTVVCLVVFDCLYYNGQSLVNEPMKKRREILKKNMIEVKYRIMFSEAEVIRKKEDLENMMIKVFKLGLEGLVLKDLESKYEPGKRHWLKVKKDYLLDGAMADSADLVVLGAWFGTGKKGGMLSIFLMGCYDESTKQWLTVTKVSTGHDDKTLESLQDSLKDKMIKLSKDNKCVPSWLKCTKTMIPDFVAKDPKNQPVWEITGAEFSQAKIHTAGGISIRFPRVTKIRDDKFWKSATSFKELQTLFKKSKENTDYSKLIRPGTSRTENDDLNFPDDAELNVNDNENDDKPKVAKRKMIENDKTDVFKVESKFKKPKKLEESRKYAPKNPLPDIFKDHILYFYTDEGETKEEYEKYIRIWRALGGDVDVTEDGRMANYVIHSKDTIQYDKYKSRKLNISNHSQHVTIEWLKQALASKEVTETSSYRVRLTN